MHGAHRTRPPVGKPAGARLLASLAVVAAVLGIIATTAWLVTRAPEDNQHHPPPQREDDPETGAAADDSRRYQAGQPPPDTNVFVFLIDALRADRLNVYGYSAHRTSPAADWLAEHGVVFEHAYAPAPWTIPSVASLFTSSFPCEHNMLSKYDRLPASADTLAERLQRAGYFTCSRFGNAFLGRHHGMDQGFDRLIGKGRTEGTAVSAALGDNPRLPFFFYAHNMEPHNPYHYAPPNAEGFRRVDWPVREQMKLHFKAYKSAGEYDYRRQVPLGTNDMTATQDEHAAALRALREDWNELYDCCVRLADARVGSTIRVLQKRGLWDNTVFIYLADHGEEIDDHGGWLHDQSVYEEVVRVPLIIRFPRDEFAGTRVDEVVSLVDVLPTIFNYIRRPDLADGARGRSLMPLIRGDDSARPETFVVPSMRHNTTRYYRPWATQRGDVNIVVRRGPWKAIWNVDVGSVELYDLSQDPREQTDVGAQYPQLRDLMRDYAAAWYQRCRQQTAPTEDVGDLDEETLRQLRSLGYVD
jgi:arylsulfatase A-like enzyme